MKHYLILLSFSVLCGNHFLGAASDGFGYTSFQTGETGAIPYSFRDISTTGNELGISRGDTDDGAGILTLSTPFPAYGQNYSQLLVSTNGYLSSDLAENGADSSNDTNLPSAPSLGSGLRIYPLHDDLQVPSGSAIHTQYFPDGIDGYPLLPTTGVQVIQWTNVSFFGLNDLFVFQVLLFDNGTIQFVYPPGNPDRGSGSTTGIQSEDLTYGLLVVQNTPDSIPDSSNITIFPPMEDLSSPEILNLSVRQNLNLVSTVSLTFTTRAGSDYIISSGVNPENLSEDSHFVETLPAANEDTKTFQRVFDTSVPAPGKLFFQVQEKTNQP